HCQVVVLPLEAEGAGHPATAGVEDPDVQAQTLQHRPLGIQTHERLVVTVAVDDGPAFEPWEMELRRLRREEFAQEKRLSAEARGVFVARKESDQFVAENGDAAWPQSHERYARIDLGSQ